MQDQTFGNFRPAGWLRETLNRSREHVCPGPIQIGDRDTRAHVGPGAARREKDGKKKTGVPSGVGWVPATMWREPQAP